MAGPAVEERELLARPPRVFHVVDDDRPSDAADRAALEAVPGVGAGDKNQAGIEGERRLADALELRVVDVGAPRGGAGIVRQVDEQREQLHADIGVRLQPEPVRVLAIFDPQQTACQADTAARLDRADQSIAPERRRDPGADRNRSRFAPEK
jgi:hypothetical protein